MKTLLCVILIIVVNLLITGILIGAENERIDKIEKLLIYIDLKTDSKLFEFSDKIDSAELKTKKRMDRIEKLLVDSGLKTEKKLFELSGKIDSTELKTKRFISEDDF